MKIAYVANMRMPTEKAHGFQIAKMCEAFADAGCSVTLIVPRRQNRIKKSPFSYYGVRENFSFKTIPTIDFYPMDRVFGKYAYFLQLVTFLKILLFFYGRELREADIIYTRGIGTAAVLAFFFKEKVIFEDHEPIENKKRYARLLRQISRKVVVSSKLSLVYEELGIKKEGFTTAPNGIDVGEVGRTKPRRALWEEEFGLEAGTPVVLYVGHFYHWKGVDTLIESARFIGHRAAVILLGGTARDFKDIDKQIRGRGIANIYLHEFIPHREALVYQKSADVLVLPNTAKEKRSKYYTSPIKLFEYMASDVPIVASDLPSFEAFLKDGENALLAKPDDPKDLAEKINELLKDKEKGKHLAAQARRDAEAYTWQKRAQKILAFAKAGNLAIM